MHIAERTTARLTCEPSLQLELRILGMVSVKEIGARFASKGFFFFFFVDSNGILDLSKPCLRPTASLQEAFRPAVLISPGIYLLI